ncbi:MAG: hypothetical protein JWN51_2809, partial [Phycisphaerales bacterium]|nr:hypothetical protein [Phycisphaerales bacterium]
RNAPQAGRLNGGVRTGFGIARRSKRWSSNGIGRAKSSKSGKGGRRGGAALWRIGRRVLILNEPWQMSRPCRKESRGTSACRGKVGWWRGVGGDYGKITIRFLILKIWDISGHFGTSALGGACSIRGDDRSFFIGQIGHDPLFDAELRGRLGDRSRLTDGIGQGRWAVGGGSGGVRITHLKKIVHNHSNHSKVAFTWVKTGVGRDGSE